MGGFCPEQCVALDQTVMTEVCKVKDCTGSSFKVEDLDECKTECLKQETCLYAYLAIGQCWMQSVTIPKVEGAECEWETNESGVNNGGIICKPKDGDFCKD